MHSSLVALRALVLVASLVPLAAQTASNQCDVNPVLSEPTSGSAWNGWGADISNSRFQTAKAGQLTASQVPHLKLKWAFGMADAKQVFGEPVVIAGMGKAFPKWDAAATLLRKRRTGTRFDG
jgi:polyvinyl alcohol dehydrogenase (cytochrome)